MKKTTTKCDVKETVRMTKLRQRAIFSWSNQNATIVAYTIFFKIIYFLQLRSSPSQICLAILFWTCFSIHFMLFVKKWKLNARMLSIKKLASVNLIVASTFSYLDVVQLRFFSHFDEYISNRSNWEFCKKKKFFFFCKFFSGIFRTNWRNVKSVYN